MTNIKPSHYIIGIILFTLLVVAGTNMISEFRLADSSFTDDTKFTEFNNTFNKMEETTAQIEEYQSNIESAENVDFGVFGVLNGLIRNSWQVLRNIFSSFSFMNDLFSNVGKMFGIPSWAASLVISLITIIIVFAIYSAIFQREL